MDLPRALKPWADLLALFPDELIEALAPLIQRLDLMVGPMRTDSRAGRGEPDGFQGLSRRGTPERLLLSEWLLADEMPDEFLRRAVMGEQAFLQIAMTVPTGGRRSIALFDTGPGQLGSPRLVHLAALLVLARRAEAAQADFSWGIAQDPDRPLLSVVNSSTVLELLAARTTRCVTANDLECWQETVCGTSDVDDLWLIGDRPIGGPPLAVLQVKDVLDPAFRQLAVSVCRSPNGPVNSAVLDLPEDRLCARLLRNPFDVSLSTPPRRAKPRFAPASNLLFAPGGTKLLARASDGGLLVYPIPNSPQGGTGKPKLYQCPTVDPIFAAGRVQKTYAIVTGVEVSGRVRIDGIGSRADRVPQGFYELSSEVLFPKTGLDAPLRPCLPYSATIGGKVFLFTMDTDGTLVRLGQDAEEEKTGTQTAHIEGRNVTALALTAGSRHLVSISRQVRDWKLEARRAYGGTGGKSLPHDGEEAARAFLGYGGEWQDETFGLVAVQKNVRQWTILSKQGEQTLSVRSDLTVVGVLGAAGMAGPGLLALESGRRRLVWLGQSWTQELPAASGKIVSVTVSMDHPNVAYVTEKGEVVVYSLSQNVILYRLTTEAAT